VCGSRDWTDADAIEAELRLLAPGSTVVHGAARGADRIAGQIARRLGLTVEEHPADWSSFGVSAGPRRNADMLRAGADFVLAFKDGFDRSMRRGGTEGMVRIALAAGVPARVVGCSGG